jgi:hypothetical protein
MSDTTSAELNFRDVLARIDRQQAETQKFVAEERKLIQEERKLTQEARKLDAEHDKLRRDRNLAPWLIGASLSGGVVAGVIGQIIQHFWK